MKKITVENYRGDKHYPRIVRATDVILARRGFVSPTELFVEMGLLRTEAIEHWRAGRLPFLEGAIQCNLSAASRILRILRFHAHDLNLRPSSTVYLRRTRGGRTPLRFSKTGEPKLEEAYARHFLRVLGKRKPPPAAPEQEAGCFA